MLRNYLTIALRTLRKRLGYAAINVIGLAVGLAACLLIALWVRHELSYDDFHEEADRIYRVNIEASSVGYDRDIALTPNIVGSLLSRELPSVEKTVRLHASGGVVRYQNRVFREEDFFFADSTFFDIFTFPFVAGDPATALTRPGTVVLTEATARRYFGEESPLGQTILFDDDTALEVTGVIGEVPSNAHFRFDFVGSWSTLDEWAQRETWSSANFYTYLLAHENVDAERLERQIDRLLAEREVAGEEEARPLSLMPLTRIHLHADLAYALDSTGDIRYVYVFASMAVLILLIACINYMNLATARSVERAVEVGMRKAVGATRPQLARQLYSESMLVVGMALFLALVLVRLGLPLFNNLSGTSYVFTTLPVRFLLVGLGGVGLFVSLVAGSYPALFLSAFRPARVLKGTFRTMQGATRFRKGLVVFQFGVAVFLMVGTLIIRGQLDYLRSKNLGFDKERVVMLPTDDPALGDALLQHTGVQSVSLVNQYPSALGWTGSATAEGLREGATVSMKGFITDADIVETLGLQVLAGRGFSETLPHPDSIESGYRYLLNETAARALGWTPKDALGRRFNAHGDRDGRVIGVVRDFHYVSLHEAIAPMAIWYHPDRAHYLLVRIAPGDVAGTLAFLKNRWADLMPHSPFKYRFLDDAFDALYRNEQQVSRMFGVFAGLAILIACLGLFGLATYTAERRTKEIGIRKTLGATATQIVGVLTADFLKLVGIAFVVAAPVAYLGMRQWLQDFAYRIEISPWFFASAGAMALLISFGTVSYQAIRAALRDPVKALRYE